jgi:hypothetical protein
MQRLLACCFATGDWESFEEPPLPKGTPVFYIYWWTTPIFATARQRNHSRSGGIARKPRQCIVGVPFPLMQPSEQFLPKIIPP